MRLHIWGTDFRRSPVEMRGRLWIPPDQRRKVLGEILDAGFEDLVYLSTCNRVEFYTTAKDYFCDTRHLWIKTLRHLGLAEDDFYRGYSLEGKSAMRHLLRVASSLESMVVGEPQILGQLKEAVNWSVENKFPVDSSLERAFRLAFETAKRVRTETAIGEKPVSVASLGLQWMEERESEIPLNRAVVVGRSPISVLVVQWLQKNRPECPILWVNRNVSLLDTIPEAAGTERISLGAFLAAPPEFSHLFTATSSPEPLFSQTFLDGICGKRVLLFDFAQPPDIDVRDSALACAQVVRLEDLRVQAEKNSLARAQAVHEAELIIEDSLRGFCIEQKEAPLLRDFSSLEPEFLRQLGEVVNALEEDFPQEMHPRVRKWADKLVKKSFHHTREQLRLVLRKISEPEEGLGPIA